MLIIILLKPRLLNVQHPTDTYIIKPVLFCQRSHLCLQKNINRRTRELCRRLALATDDVAIALSSDWSDRSAWSAQIARDGLGLHVAMGLSPSVHRPTRVLTIYRYGWFHLRRRIFFFWIRYSASTSLTKKLLGNWYLRTKCLDMNPCSSGFSSCFPSTTMYFSVLFTFISFGVNCCTSNMTCGI